MQIFKHLFENGLVGLALIGVLVLFLVAVGAAICASIKNRALIAGNEFTCVASTVARLVLGVASDIIRSPATVQIPDLLKPSQPNTSRPTSDSASQSGISAVTFQVRISNDKISAFRAIYTWAYVLAGLLCLVASVCLTPITHGLAKSVWLTMLGFMITIVGGIAQPAQIPQSASVRGNYYSLVAQRRFAYF